METIGLTLKLALLALEVFKDERGDRYSRLKNDLLKIEKEWQDEMALPDDERSDLALDSLVFDSRQLFERIVTEAQNRN